MKPLFISLFILLGTYHATVAQPQTPIQSLNQYVGFINASVGVATNRFQMLRTYTDAVTLYRKKPEYLLNLPSSGPLDEFYFRKSMQGNPLPVSDKQRLNAQANTLWALLNKLDQTCKALETHVRLKAYQNDNLRQSDVYVGEIEELLRQLSQEQAGFYHQIQQVYRHYQPFIPSDPYLSTEKEMEQVLVAQKKLMDTLPFYLREDGQPEWPLETVRQSMLEDKKMLVNFGKSAGKLGYPASDMVISFKSALTSVLNVKQNAVDDHNFAARQSTRHGNEVYLALLNYLNNDLLATHKSFVNYSRSAKQLLDYVEFSPVVTQAFADSKKETSSAAQPFVDQPPTPFDVKPSSTPASSAMLSTLNGYVDFINESLNQMQRLQVIVRNYQWSAEHYRDPGNSGRRANLTYAHDDFKVPEASYALLRQAGSTLSQSYRPAVENQAAVLMNILREMDALSIELIRYTSDKKYLTDQLKRSDEILDRYVYLFGIFDRKKEQLYLDLRRIHGSFPAANPGSSWVVAGVAMLKTMDQDRDVLFGVKDYLRNETNQVPAVERLSALARKLIEDEYKNMKGLQRYGRSNGLCPYTPYEDLAANTLQFAEMAQKLRRVSTNVSRHPYESFYYYYNNQLVYLYNNFTELAKAGLLKMVNQPDVFAFRKEQNVVIENAPVASRPSTPPRSNVSTESSKTTPESAAVPVTRVQTTTVAKPGRDTVFIERVRVDTVYVNSGNNGTGVSRTLEGFATNNMVLLLDVSASMDSPLKLPLLKRSIKSLLTLLRPEDRISIVLYSGKARVVLKPTSGSKAAEIGRMIDLLQSSGDTDGNGGILLAYKVANKAYIRGGNNRIILATDGEFPVSDEVLAMVGQNARQDVNLTVFTFGRNQLNGRKLRKLSELGQGSYTHVTQESADLQLILEAQAKGKVSP
jgi:Ca-activated chloride channel family protein